MLQVMNDFFLTLKNKEIIDILDRHNDIIDTTHTTPHSLDPSVLMPTVTALPR